MSAYRTWATTPITGRPEYSVVIPAYNEEIRILPTIGAIAVEMSELGKPWELLVADDGSTDSTVQLVEDLDLVNVRVLRSPNTGKGGAVRRGMQAARGRYLLFADADQSTPIEQFRDLLAAIETGGADIAIGSRAFAGAEVQSKSMARKVVSGGLNLIVRLGFGVPIADTQCGFKLFTAEAAETLFAMQKVDGFSFDFELLWLAQRHGMKTTEVPVEWIDAPGSTVDPLKDSIRFLGDLARMRWWAIRGEYQNTPSTPATAIPRKQEQYS